MRNFFSLHLFLYYVLIAGSACQIENFLAWLDIRHLNRQTLPEPVDAERHHIVHQIVITGDGIEYAPHALGLFLLGNLFKAEMGGGLFRHAR